MNDLSASVVFIVGTIGVLIAHWRARRMFRRMRECRWRRRMIVEFPPDTVEVIDNLSRDIKLDRMEVISRGLGLLQFWLDAHKNQRTIVERPAGGATRN